MKKTVVILASVLTLLCFVGCDNKEKNPVSIYLDPSFVSSAYEVDSEINMDGATMKLIYADGTTQSVRCEKEMIVGFDTSTTGIKELYAVHKGVESNRVSYQVYNPEGISRVVETSMRLIVTKTVSGGKTILTFSLRNVDVGVRALGCTLHSSSNFSDALYDLSGTVTGDMTDYYWSKTSPTALSVVLYAREPMRGDGYVFNVEWVTEEDVDFSITEITVSDGNKDYYLPRVQ